MRDFGGNFLVESKNVKKAKASPFRLAIDVLT